MNNAIKTHKKLKFASTSGPKNWVGDGFNVHTMFRPDPALDPYISPFLLMDYGPPKEFSPTNQRRGVGSHPHRGFETVTFAYQGEVEHKDSTGGGGVIQAGDVQWMTAGGGVVHSEFHSDHFSASGGVMEMVQLWVNLPKKDKMTAPKYQAVTAKQIPTVQVGDGLSLRVIAGAYGETAGPCSTFTPINVYDLTSEKKTEVSLGFTSGSNTLVLVLRGELEFEGTSYPQQSLLIFEQEGEEVRFTADDQFKGLVLNGDPINEPVYAHGPFVMNTKQEIIEAIDDFQAGKMGVID